MPNYVPMEMQVCLFNQYTSNMVLTITIHVQILSGILPISKVSAVPSSIYFVSQKLPLERVMNLVHPSTKLEPVEDKRTWREDKRSKDPIGFSNPVWTAMDILTAYADAKGWLTAKAGRPDVHRAGNACMLLFQFTVYLIILINTYARYSTARCGGGPYRMGLLATWDTT